MNDLRWLQCLVCNEVKVEMGTIDNPGWFIIINLIGTTMEDSDFAKIKIDNSETDWYICFVKDNQFTGVSSPQNFQLIFKILREWWK